MGDCDKYTRDLGDSTVIFNGCEVKHKRVKHVINVVVSV